MSKRNLIWLLMAFFFIADLAAAVHKGNKEVVLSEQFNFLNPRIIRKRFFGYPKVLLIC